MAATANEIIGGPGRIGGLVHKAAAAPTVDNDSANGVNIGDVWINTATAPDTVMVCSDNTAGAAVWNVVGGVIAPATSGVTERVIDEVNLGNGSVYRRAFIEEALVFTADASADLTTQIPALSRVVAASINMDTLVVLDTAVKVGFGTQADPDGLVIAATLTKNAKANDVSPTLTSFDTATTLRVSAVDTNGAAAGTVTSGTVRARVIYDYVTSIGNA